MRHVFSRSGLLTESLQALEKLEISDLVLIDQTYLNRINLRKRLIRQYRDVVIQPGPIRAQPSVDELYSWMLGTYLPTRFPTMFTLVQPQSFSRATTGPELKSLVTSEAWPVEPPQDVIQALEILGTVVDVDWLFMIPAEDGDGYVLGAFIACYPNGFAWKNMIGKKLRDIHVRNTGLSLSCLIVVSLMVVDPNSPIQSQVGKKHGPDFCQYGPGEICQTCKRRSMENALGGCSLGCWSHLSADQSSLISGPSPHIQTCSIQRGRAPKRKRAISM